MAFQRAQWHSGLTYEHVCTNCRTVVQYTDYSLDFRPWYPDGFVDCPNCRAHLRHSEQYAINAPENAPVMSLDGHVASQNTAGGTAAFCPNCGSRFADGQRFCSMCGAKRP